MDNKNLKIIANDLVPVYETSSGEKIVYGLELHKVLKVKSNYREWITRRFLDTDAVENKDFQVVEITTPSGQTKKNHIILLDIAKEMAMLERNEKGKQVRRYFIQIEERYKQLLPQCQKLDSYMIDDPADRARRWIEEYEEKKQLEEENVKLLETNTQLKDENTEMKPKAEFYDRVGDMSDTISVTKMAALISKEQNFKLSSKILFEYLRKKGYLCVADYAWNKPSQSMIDKGYMIYTEFNRRTWNAKSRRHENEISFTPKITGKGQQFIVKMVLRDKEYIEQIKKWV